MKQLTDFIKHWPRAAVLMAAGALIGWIAWMFLPQNYTAETRLSVGIDLKHTGKLDTLEQDRIIGITEDILHSDTVMEPVFAASASYADQGDLFDHTRISRTNETWILSVTGTDPAEAGKLAALWLKTAHDALTEALLHAVRADAYRNELEAMTQCIPDKTAGGISSECPGDPEAISRNIQNWSDLFLEEQRLSRGISPAIQLGAADPNRIELHAASRSAGMDVLLGALAGFLVSFALVWFPKNREDPA